MTPENKQFGLTPTPDDARDFLFGAIFSLPKLEELPDEFVHETLGIKNQGTNDLCTAYGATTCSELQEGVELSPEYQFAKTKQIMGGDPNVWGADIRSTCKSFVKYGSLPVGEYKIEGNPRDGESWSQYDKQALKHRKKSYFKVSGQYDLFDNIRATIWANRAEKQAIITGVIWKYGWNVANIPKEILQGAYGHLIAGIGWEKTYKEKYLVIQNSYGEAFGDNGLNYFPREVVNREFTFGSYTFKDMPIVQAKHLAQNNLKADSYWWVNLFKTLCR